jgi:hypothetical protein
MHTYISFSFRLVPASHNALSRNKYSYGLSPVYNLPNGFSPLLETWGKGKNRFPLLVQFNHPSTWVVTLPNNNVNGEDGTVQAGEYAKGDTATLFVYEGDGHVDVCCTVG